MIRRRIASFGYAFEGLAAMLRTQPNAWIHTVATVLVVTAAWWLEAAASDWALLVVAMALVRVAEALNTAIEFLADAAVPDHHALIKHAKDVAAAAVLLASIAATVIGALVFVPLLG